MRDRRYLVGLIFLFSPVLWAQGPAGWTPDSTDAYFGTDDYLVNGRPYTPAHGSATGHPFLFEQEWQPGILYIHHHRFEPVGIKYDLETQSVLLQHTSGGPGFATLVLSGHLVDSFDIWNSRFIRQVHTGHPDSTSGYAEVVYRGRFEVYRQLSKEFLATYNPLTPRGAYSQMGVRYHLFFPEADRWVTCTTTSTLLKAFPDKGRQLRKMARQRHLRLKHISSQTLNQLLTASDAL